MSTISWIRERYPVFSALLAFIACCIAAADVRGTGFCGALALLFNIVILILYCMCARMYKNQNSYTESYQIIAQVVTWCNAYQLGLMCPNMGWPNVLSVFAYMMFCVEYKERTIASFQIQSASVNMDGIN